MARGVDRQGIVRPSGALVATEVVDTAESIAVRRDGEILCLFRTREAREENAFLFEADTTSSETCGELFRVDDR